LARRPSIIYRVRKKVAKHKGLAAIVSFSVLAVLILSALWIADRQQARRREALGRQMEQQARKIEMTSRQMYLLPLHDVTAEKHLILQRLQLLEEQMKQLD